MQNDRIGFKSSPASVFSLSGPTCSDSQAFPANLIMLDSLNWRLDVFNLSFPIWTLTHSQDFPGFPGCPDLTPSPRGPMVLRKESGSRTLPPALEDFRFGGIPCH